MPRFNCPHCGGTVKAPDEKQGAAGICPRCNKSLTVPGEPPVALVDESTDQLEVEQQSQPASVDKEAAASPGGAKSGAAAGGGALVLLALGSYFLYRTGLGRRLFVEPLAGLLAAQGVPAATLVAAIVVISLVAIILLIAACIWIKSTLLAQMPIDLEFPRVSPDKLGGLDGMALERYTQEFEAVGFHHALDYSVKSEAPSRNIGFARLFIHPREKCYAEANQVIPAGEGKGAPMRCNVMSILEDGWSLSSGTRDPLSVKTMWMWRQPKKLWTCHPGASGQQLVKSHLELRRELIDGLGVDPVTDVSPNAYFEHQRQSAVDRRETFRRKNILINLIQLWLFGKSPRSQWLGAYPKLAGTRQQ
jgi:hypothetical protein